MSDTTHLDPEAEALLSRPLAERIAFARRDLYVGHAGANDVLAALEDLLVHPRVTRMPCLLVAASAGNGKTTMLRTFRDRHPVVQREDHYPSVPVVVMDMPEKPLDWAFWSALLTALRIAHREKAPGNKAQAISVMRQLRCRMLLIDEIHNVLQLRVAEQRQMLALLKNLTNELMIPVVVAGTRDAIRTLHTDEQLADRFGVVSLPKWQLDTRFRQLLRSFERMMPLAKPSDLAGRELAPRIFDLSRQTIGSTLNVVRAATVLALDHEERITPDLLEKVRNSPLKGYRGEDL